MLWSETFIGGTCDVRSSFFIEAIFTKEYQSRKIFGFPEQFLPIIGWCLFSILTIRRPICNHKSIAFSIADKRNWFEGKVERGTHFCADMHPKYAVNSGRRKYPRYKIARQKEKIQTKDQTSAFNRTCAFFVLFAKCRERKRHNNCKV